MPLQISVLSLWRLANPSELYYYRDGVKGLLESTSGSESSYFVAEYVAIVGEGTRPGSHVGSLSSITSYSDLSSCLSHVLLEETSHCFEFELVVEP